MTRGRPPKVVFPFTRTEVCSGVDFERVVEEGTPVSCLRCRMLFRINKDNSYRLKASLDDMLYVRCPVCGYRAALPDYWPQTERYRKMVLRRAARARGERD